MRVPLAEVVESRVLVTRAREEPSHEPAMGAGIANEVGHTATCALHGEVDHQKTAVAQILAGEHAADLAIARAPQLPAQLGGYVCRQHDLDHAASFGRSAVKAFTALATSDPFGGSAWRGGGAPRLIGQTSNAPEKIHSLRSPIM